MEFIKLGKTGEKISVIGIGTWKLGSDKKKEIAAIKHGISLGINLVDTAEMYANEEIIGEAISGENVFIATKVSPANFNENSVIASCNSSLKKLGVKSIDLYQLHWPNYAVKITETMRAMEKLMDDGKIRNIGVSNFSIKELEEANAALKKYEIVSNQIEYSVLVRSVGDLLSDFCRKNKITIIAYSPFGSGALYNKKYTECFEILKKIGTAHMKTPSQVALNWLISKGNISAIPKASSIEHMTENATSIGWELSKSEIKKIDDLGQFKSPLSSKLNGFTKRTAPIWSNIMTNLEKRRIKKHSDTNYSSPE